MQPSAKDAGVNDLEGKGTAHDATGSIIATSRFSSIVRILINGFENELPFSKGVFYTFGEKCEGSMDNILENEMEVNVSYKFSPTKNKPYIIAVWLGDKPNDLSDDYILNPIYGQKSRVIQIDGENVIVQCDTSAFLVLMEKRVVFRDSCRFGEGTAFEIKIGEIITYDAVPFKREENQHRYPSEVMFQATCGWIGVTEPRLVDRFGLRTTKNELQKTLGLTEEEVYHGVVVVIPNDVVAFVEIGSVERKVMLFRSSFNECCRRMQDVVAIGDLLRVQVRLGHLFRGKKQWFAMQAWRVRTEIGACGNKDQSGEHVPIESVSSGENYKKPDTVPSVKCPDLFEGTDGRNVQTDATLSEEGAEPGVKLKRKKTRTRNRVKKEGCDGEKSLLIEAPGVSSSVGKLGQAEKAAVNKELPPADYPQQDNVKDGNEIISPTANLKNDLETERIDEINNGTPRHRIETFLTNVDAAHSREEAETAGRNGESTPSKKSANLDKYEVTGTDVEYEEFENAASESCVDVDAQGTLHQRAAKFVRDSPLLFTYPPLTGIISRFSFDSALILYEDLRIFVSRQVVFINGSFSTTGQFLNLIASGESLVNFEAVLVKNDVDGSKPSHYAVCVWIGEKPSLTSFLSPCAPMMSLAENSDETFTGSVTKFYLPNVAIICLSHGDVKPSTVCLHVKTLRSEIEPRFDCGIKNCIADFVTLQEFVEFSVRRNAAHPQIFEAWKVTFIGRKRAYERKTKMEKEKLIISSLKRLPPPEDFDVVESSPVVSVSSAFIIDRPSERRSFLLNFLGAMRFEEKSAEGNFKIKHALGHCYTAENTIIYGVDQSSTFNHLRGQNQETCHVRFDAEVVGSLSNADSIIVKSVWASDCHRPSPEHCLRSELAYSVSRAFLRSRSYEGKITCIPFHDCAIAVVHGFKVLVPLDALVLPEKLNPDYHTIDVFFSEGDVVSLRIAEQKYQNESCLKFLKAFECWKLVRYTADGLSEDIKATAAAEELSWSDVWGLGEYCRTSPLVKREGRFCVEFASSKRLGLNLRIDLSRSFFFVDGFYVEISDHELEEHLGRDVTFHVAHVHPDKLMTRTSYGMFIDYFWIGEEPSIFNLLQDFCVLEGLVNPECWYEAFVEDFPIPTHAVGRIGHVPVLVPLRQIEIDGKFVKADTDMRKKQRVLVRVKEDSAISIGDNEERRVSFVIAVEVKKCPDVVNVLRNVSGVVVSLPCPTGKIKIDNADIEVVFDLCHVCNWEDGSICGTTLDNWFRFVKKHLQVGIRVTLTAVRESCKNSYRTLEVRLERPVRGIRETKEDAAVEYEC